MNYVIVDLEATCWEKRSGPDVMETIELGAVRLAGPAGPLGDEFARFVRPLASPVLSAFCTHLTGITQADVDGAAAFPAVLAEFAAWAGPEPLTWCSWGAYDLRQLQADCARHGGEFPAPLARHINLKQAFADLERTPPCGMHSALARYEIALAGRHHRALDDARNIAALAMRILPRLAGQAGS